MGAYGEHSSRLGNFEGFKLVTNLKETKDAKCKVWSRKEEAPSTATRVRFYQHFSAFMAMLWEFKAKVVALEAKGI